MVGRSIRPSRSHVQCDPVRIVLGSDERTALTDAVVADLEPPGRRRRRSVGPLAGDDAQWAEVGPARSGRRWRRRGRQRRAVLLDRDRRVDRGEQGGRRAGRAVRRRGDRGRGPALERRQRARDEPAARPARRSRTKCSTPGSRPSADPAEARRTSPPCELGSPRLAVSASDADLRDALDARTRRLGDGAPKARTHSGGDQPKSRPSASRCTRSMP